MKRSEHERAVLESLSSLPGSARVAFAAACAERLFAAAASSNPESIPPTVRYSLDVAWSNARGNSSSEDLAAQTSQLEELLGSEDSETFSESAAREQDAVAAVVHTLRQIARADPQHAGWAARQVCDALDRQAQIRLGPGLFDGGREDLIESVSEIVAERARQLRDLRSLQEKGLAPEALDALRVRASEEGVRLFRPQA